MVLRMVLDFFKLNSPYFFGDYVFIYNRAGVTLKLAYANVIIF